MTRQEIPFRDQIADYADVSARYARNQATLTELKQAHHDYNPRYDKAITNMVWHQSLEGRALLGIKRGLSHLWGKISFSPRKQGR